MAANTSRNNVRDATPPEGRRLPGSLPVRLDEVYTLVDFKQRTGLGKDGIRAARRKGLRICKCGRNRYVTGSDWFAFLTKNPDPSA